MKQVTVRDGKGAKDHYTVLPESLIPELGQHLERVQLRHQEDLRAGCGSVYLPGGLDRKYPNAAHECRWQVLSRRGLSGIAQRFNVGDVGSAMHQSRRDGCMGGRCCLHSYR
jgi:hypothetical protein